MRKRMMVKEKKCLQDIVIEMYWNAKFTWNFLQFKYFFNNINNLVFWRFWKPSRMKLKLFHLDIIWKRYYYLKLALRDGLVAFQFKTKMQTNRLTHVFCLWALSTSYIKDIYSIVLLLWDAYLNLRWVKKWLTHEMEIVK